MTGFGGGLRCPSAASGTFFQQLFLQSISLQKIYFKKNQNTVFLLNSMLMQDLRCLDQLQSKAFKHNVRWQMIHVFRGYVF